MVTWMLANRYVREVANRYVREVENALNDNRLSFIHFAIHVQKNSTYAY